MCINDDDDDDNNNNNNGVINNNYERLQDFVSLFRIPMGTRNNFFEIYRQFGQASSKWFPSPGLCESPEIQ